MGYRFYQKQVVDHAGFQGVVEASMMLVAYEVMEEDPATPGHEQRAGVARSVFQGDPFDLTRFTRLFSWRAIFDSQVQEEVYDRATADITPELLDDEHVDSLVREFWNVAAEYHGEGEKEEDAGADSPESLGSHIATNDSL